MPERLPGRPRLGPMALRGKTEGRLLEGPFPFGMGEEVPVRDGPDERPVDVVAPGPRTGVGAPHLPQGAAELGKEW